MQTLRGASAKTTIFCLALRLASKLELGKWLLSNCSGRIKQLLCLGLCMFWCDNLFYWLASCEAMDQHARYQRAMRAVEAVAKIGGGHFKRQGMTKTIMRVDSFLDISKIQDQLSKPCWVGKDRHACLDLFAENPQLEPQLQCLYFKLLPLQFIVSTILGATFQVKNWRSLWVSLPKIQRQQKVLDLIRSGRFTFLGVTVPVSATRCFPIGF